MGGSILGYPNFGKVPYIEFSAVYAMICDRGRLFSRAGVQSDSHVSAGCSEVCWPLRWDQPVHEL